MDVYGGQTPMAAYLREHRDKVVGRWCELAVADARGRISPAELRQELDDLYSLLLRVMSQEDEDAPGELRRRSTRCRDPAP